MKFPRLQPRVSCDHFAAFADAKDELPVNIQKRISAATLAALGFTTSAHAHGFGHFGHGDGGGFVVLVIVAVALVALVKNEGSKSP
jgi:hypothetical protein